MWGVSLAGDGGLLACVEKLMREKWKLDLDISTVVPGSRDMEYGRPGINSGSMNSGKCNWLKGLNSPPRYLCCFTCRSG